jgi:hypothetical protein
MIGMAQRSLLIERPTDASRNHMIKLPFELRRRGVEARLVLGNKQQQPGDTDAVLLDTIARAADWLPRLTSQKALSIAEIGRQDDVDDGEISRTLPLAFLAPDILETIVQGRQPITLTATYLKRLKPLPTSWFEQRCVLGFAAVRGDARQDNPTIDEQPVTLIFTCYRQEPSSSLVARKVTRRAPRSLGTMQLLTTAKARTI